MTCSIIIPVYNAVKYLPQCLESVLAQTYPDWECVCVDDGSTDGSGALLDQYGQRDARFKIFHQENGGEGSARNRGLGLVSGDVVTWLDADDFLEHGTVKAALRLFLKDESIDMVRVRHVRVVGETVPRLFDQSYAVKRICGEHKVRSWALKTLTQEGYCCVTYIRRPLFKYPFPVGVQYAGDSMFMLANAYGMKNVVQSEYVGYYYRDVPNSVMKRRFPSAERVRYFDAFEKVACKYGHNPNLSWAAWFNLVNWVIRPSDLIEATQIHQKFGCCVSKSLVCIHELPPYARPLCWLFCQFGWRLPIRIGYGALGLLVRSRNTLR